MLEVERRRPILDSPQGWSRAILKVRLASSSGHGAAPALQAAGQIHFIFPARTTRTAFVRLGEGGDARLRIRAALPCTRLRLGWSSRRMAIHRSSSGRRNAPLHEDERPEPGPEHSEAFADKKMAAAASNAVPGVRCLRLGRGIPCNC